MLNGAEELICYKQSDLAFIVEVRKGSVKVVDKGSTYTIMLIALLSILLNLLYVCCYFYFAYWLYAQ